MIRNIRNTKLRLRLIPNVTKFRVANVEIQPRPLLFGVVKKTRTFDLAKANRIEKYNKFLRRNYSRLIKYAQNPAKVEQFERLARVLIRSSHAYQLAMLSSASKHWYTMPRRKVIKLYNQVMGLRDSTELKYERWWIDKKPGDFARPIGAPKLPWKVIMLKYLQVFEIYYLSNNIYPEWQHAGTAGRGLISAWTDVLKKAMPSPYIYEFDIKGFFDRIRNQDSVKELPILNSQINKMVNAQPSKYHLPSEEADPATSKFKDILLNFKEVVNRLTGEKITIDMDWGKREITPEMFGIHLRPATSSREAPEKFLDPEDGSNEIYPIGEATSTYTLEEEAEWDAIEAKLLGKLEIAKEYKNLMDHDRERTLTKRVGFTAEREVEPITETQRGKGRDDWKGLGKENQGFPQGANFSPFLSCLTLGKAIKDLPGLIMYMDDGLIYAETKGELSQRIRRLKERLSTIGLSLAEEKSGIIKTPTFFKGIKFLGIRIKSELDMWSETRKGTIKPAKMEVLSKGRFQELERYLTVELGHSMEPTTYEELLKEWLPYSKQYVLDLKTSTASERRVQNWIANKARNPIDGLNWATRQGFFSSIVAKIFDPTLGQQDREILAGQITKLNLIMRERSLASIVYKVKRLRDEEYVPDITTISTEACLYLAKVIRRGKTRRSRR